MSSIDISANRTSKFVSTCSRGFDVIGLRPPYLFLELSYTEQKVSTAHANGIKAIMMAGIHRIIPRLTYISVESKPAASSKIV